MKLPLLPVGTLTILLPSLLYNTLSTTLNAVFPLFICISVQFAHEFLIWFITSVSLLYIIVCKLVQSINTCCPILFNPLPIVIVCNDEQVLNPRSLTVITLFPRLILVIFEQLLKAYCPISVTPSAVVKLPFLPDGTFIILVPSLLYNTLSTTLNALFPLFNCISVQFTQPFPIPFITSVSLLYIIVSKFEQLTNAWASALFNPLPIVIVCIPEQ